MGLADRMEVRLAGKRFWLLGTIFLLSDRFQRTLSQRTLESLIALGLAAIFAGRFHLPWMDLGSGF